MTSKYRKLALFFTILSLLLNICPLAVYSVKAMVESNLVYEKVALAMTVFIVLILTIVCFVNKITLRSRLWIILIGVYFCLGEILTPLIMIACCQVIDELIVHPLKTHYKNKITINKEIDKRL
jgi:hypothetical protein